MNRRLSVARAVAKRPVSEMRFHHLVSHEIGRLDPLTREALGVLGAVLRELRLERGLSQRSLAGRCGLSQPTISRLESGKAEGVRVAWIARLLAGLDGGVQIIPDDRHLVDRCNGFRKLRRAFDTARGDARARERERQRRLTVGEILFRAELERMTRDDKAEEFARFEP